MDLSGAVKSFQNCTSMSTSERNFINLGTLSLIWDLGSGAPRSKLIVTPTFLDWLRVNLSNRIRTVMLYHTGRTAVSLWAEYFGRRIFESKFCVFQECKIITNNCTYQKTSHMNGRTERNIRVSDN